MGWATGNAPGGQLIPYVELSEIQPDGTDGGSTVATTWTTRVLNTEVDPFSLCALASNQFTLTAGTWRIRAMSSLGGSGWSTLRLRNVTAGATLLNGETQLVEATGEGACHMGHLVGIFTVAAGQALALQYYVATAGSGWGLGFDNQGGEGNVYTYISLEKLS